MLQEILIVFCTENYSKLFLKKICNDLLQENFQISIYIFINDGCINGATAELLLGVTVENYVWSLTLD